MTITFEPPLVTVDSHIHHASAAALNESVATDAIAVLRDALDGTNEVERILLKAAAGAGKSYVLKRMVADAVTHPRCRRVGVVAFQKRQTYPLASSLGARLGADRVCLLASKDSEPEVPDAVRANAAVVIRAPEIPSVDVVLGTCHRLGAFNERNRLLEHFGPGENGEAPFDVLFVDEAWQLPHHLFDTVKSLAPIVVGVGDVGQLPPLEIGTNPWRGDPGYNPYRAWPTDHDGDPKTWSAELPTVWRPTAAQLGLWRAFYPEWTSLDCVAGPTDRSIDVSQLTGLARSVWEQVATGVPLLLEVDGLDPAEAADVDLPLVAFVERLLDDLFTAGFALTTRDYDDAGKPKGRAKTVRPGSDPADPIVAVLATRNQAVDDAADAVERLRERHSLTEKDLVASTVDSWQGQTNHITVAVHPLTGASQLDEFNSAFGRLAVACTRATHGLLIVSRPGLDELLTQAPARPGTPFGEPGNRQLPRQTHQRILATFTRGKVTVKRRKK